MTQMPSALAVLPLLFAAMCLWQLVAGLGKMRRARANSDDPMAPVLSRFGMVQAALGGLFLLANIGLNLPALLSVLRGG